MPKREYLLSAIGSAMKTGSTDARIVRYRHTSGRGGYGNTTPGAGGYDTKAPHQKPVEPAVHASGRGGAGNIHSEY
jgi:hypothetical protein